MNMRCEAFVGADFKKGDVMFVKKISKSVSLAIILISSVFCGLPASAAMTPPTRTPHETLKILTQKSELVVEGRLLSVNPSYYDQDPIFGNQTKIIVTDYRVVVDRVLKGSIAGDKILIRIPGGCIETDDLCFRTDLMPKLHSDEKYILFLNSTVDGKWTIWDVADGKQTISSSICSPLNLSLQETLNIIED